MLLEQDAVGVVAPVPDVDVARRAGAPLLFAPEQIEVGCKLRAEPAFKVGEEFHHVVGRLGHPQLEHVGGPGGIAEPPRDLVAHADRFFEQRDVVAG